MQGAMSMQPALKLDNFYDSDEIAEFLLPQLCNSMSYKSVVTSSINSNHVQIVGIKYVSRCQSFQVTSYRGLKRTDFLWQP